jgi:hypothetical protein
MRSAKGPSVLSARFLTATGLVAQAWLRRASFRRGWFRGGVELIPRILMDLSALPSGILGPVTLLSSGPN